MKNEYFLYRNGSKQGRILRNPIKEKALLRGYFFSSEHARVIGTPE